IKVGLCEQQQTGWLGIPGVFDPHWLIDPEPIWAQLVEVVATGLPEGETVTVRGAGAHVIGELFVDGSGAVETGAFLEAADRPALSLHRTRSGARATGPVYVAQ